MSIAGYTNTGPFDTPHKSIPDLSWDDLPLISHDIEVFRSRGIPPEIASEGGCYTKNGALHIPHYDTSGDVWTVQRRPHNRRPGAPKYLFDAGTRMRIHVPPSEREKLLDVRIPIILTESALKAAAIIAALRTFGLADQYAVISIPGVTTWQRNGSAFPDFKFFESRVKERGKIVYRRPLIIAFDSNASTNPDVIVARWDLTEYLRSDRKHDVQWLDVPEGPGSTQKERERGIDDVLAQGIATMPEMLASIYPAPEIMPEIEIDAIHKVDGLSEIDRLRLERDVWEARAQKAERHVSLITELAISPHYTENEKILIIRAGACALSEAAHVPLDDGNIQLDPGKLSNDLRPTDKQHPDYEAYKRSPVNPVHQDARGHHFGGDHWYMRRSSVVPTIKSLEKKLGAAAPIHAKPDYVREPGDPSPRRVSIITMKRPDNMVDFLEAVIRYRPECATDRPYQVQDPCPHCHEVHSRTRRTFCDGCGEETEAPKVLPIPPADIPEITDEQRERLDQITAGPVNRENLFTGRSPVNSPSSPASPPVTICSEKIYLPVGPAEIDGETVDVETGEILSDQSLSVESDSWIDEHRQIYGDLYRSGVAS